MTHADPLNVSLRTLQLPSGDSTAGQPPSDAPGLDIVADVYAGASKSLLLPTLRMVFWRKLLKKCNHGDANILADDEKVPKSSDIDRIKQVALHQSQQGLELIQRIHGEPTKTQWDQACKQYTIENKDLSTKTKEEALLLKEIKGPISKFRDTSPLKPEDILAFLNQQIQIFAKGAIACFERTYSASPCCIEPPFEKGGSEEKRSVILPVVTVALY
eukprot:GHVU01061955.1.p1 GENE.GHVU01061955.1~~GHVU01061955.1.p1  ORF type:complete len:216 (+),score=16.41 GHVU01061955.1:647-1294(+)